MVGYLPTSACLRPARIRQSTAMSFARVLLSARHLCCLVSLSRFTAPCCSNLTKDVARTSRDTSRYHELSFETGTPESERVTVVQTWRTASRYFAQPTHIYTHTHARARQGSPKKQRTPIARQRCEIMSKADTIAQVTCTRMYWSRDNHAKTSIARMTILREQSFLTRRTASYFEQSAQLVRSLVEKGRDRRRRDAIRYHMTRDDATRPTRATDCGELSLETRRGARSRSVRF